MVGTFFTRTGGTQEPWELRGTNDARIRSLENRAATLEAKLSCRLNLDADRPINAGTDTAIQFGVDTYDPGGFHDPVTNNTRLTMPVTGRYMVGGVVTLTGLTGTTHRAVYLAKNGSITIRPTAAELVVPNADTVAMPVAEFDIYSAGDYLELYVWHNASGPLTAKAQGGIYATNFWVHYLGAS